MSKLQDTMKVYFFGCRNGQVGHYLIEPSGKTIAYWDWSRVLPWDSIDGALPPHDRAAGSWQRTEVEGHAQLHHKADWTALAWWDRSVDTRGGCNAALFAQGTHDANRMLEIGREHFPDIMARFTYQIRL